MRDINRIDSMLNTINRIWKKHPDLRLMQLLTNVTGDGPFIYYLEDDQLQEALNSFYEPGKSDNTTE